MNLYQCVQQGVPCHINEYGIFDAAAKLELVNPATVDQIINRSAFCTAVPLDLIRDDVEGNLLTLNDHLSGLSRKVGIYHLWIEIGQCDDHSIHSLLCVYVGKGIAQNRVMSHIKDKWPEETLLRVTFFECSNRLAKYYEQLFLDSYKFFLNNSENTGTSPLYARWEESRLVLGTEVQQMADRWSQKFGDDFSLE
jgi:hypothetical protein